MNSSEKFSLVESVFNQAIALEPNDRESFIQKALKDDQELIDQLKKMLRISESQNDSVENAVKHVADQVVKDEQDKSGQIIDKFKLTKKLGQGGMGEVYLAKRVDKEFQQEVAIKIIRSDIYHSQVNNLFVKERQILADLNHPNICRLLDGGTSEQGETFLVMEYIDGVPLNQYCNDNKLTYRDKAKLFLKVCSAVEAAHQKLIIHCDLKPTNILVTPDGEPKLLDFGIAKLLTTEQEHLETASDTAVTYNYASPEQLRGEHPNLSSDVFSLGVIFSEIISGESFYRLDKTVIGKIESFRQNKTQTMPKENLYDAIANIATPISESPLRWICEKASSFDGPSRYQTVEALKTDVQRYLDKFPVKAKDYSFLSSILYWMRRRKVAAAFMLVLMVTLSSWAYRETEMRQSAEVELERTEKVVQFMVGLFEETDTSINGGKQFTGKELLDRGRASIKEELKSEAHTSVPIMRSMAKAYLGLGELKEAEQVLLNTLDRQKEVDSKNSRQLALIYESLGEVLLFQNRHEESERFLLKSINAYTMTGYVPDSVFDVHSKLLFQQGRYQEVIDYVNQAIKSYEVNTSKIRGNRFIGFLQMRADILQETGDYELARKQYEIALQEQEKLTGKVHRNYVTILNNLIGFLTVLQLNGDIEDRIKEQIRLLKALYPHGHVSIQSAQNTLAVFYVTQGRFNEAESYYLEMIETFQLENKTDSLLYPRMLQNLGFAYLQLERYTDAKFQFEESLQLVKKIFPNGHHSLGISQLNLSLALLGTNDLKRAEIHLKKALKITERDNYPIFWKSIIYKIYARFFRLREDFDSAEKWLQQSDGLLENAIKSPHVAKAGLQLDRAQLSLASGKFEEALERTNKAKELAEEADVKNRMYFAHFDLVKGEVFLKLGRKNEAILLLNSAKEIFSKTHALDSKSMKKISSLLENIKH